MLRNVFHEVRQLVDESEEAPDLGQVAGRREVGESPDELRIWSIAIP